MPQDPNNRVQTFCYDGSGMLRPIAGNEGRHITYSHASKECKEHATELGPGSSKPPPKGAPVLTQTFEFRLSGSELHEQTVPIPEFVTGHVVVAAGRMQIYLTRNGEIIAPSDIGGIEVDPAVRPGCSCAPRA